MVLLNKNTSFKQASNIHHIPPI